MIGSKCFCTMACFLAFLTDALAVPRISRISPEVVRLNSTITVRGQNFYGDHIALVFSGHITRYDGSKQEVQAIRLEASVINDREIRAKVNRAFVEALGLHAGHFEGAVTVEGLRDGPASKKWSAAMFPPDVLTVLVRIFGFANTHSTMPHVWIIVTAYLLLALFLLLAVFALFAGVASWAERRIAGRIQNRIGPNRVGPQGFLQWLADGVKCFLKEDFIPPHSLQFLFRLGPYFPMVGVVATLVTLPFGFSLVVADLNVGVYYVLAVTGFTVIGILIGGFASANKWSLLGGFRSAAQIVSYEIPTGLAVATVVVIAGSLGFQSIVESQGGWPWQWYLFHNPFTLLAFFFFLVSSLAEGNRTPFDLPEAESELVAGYNTEYSGLRFVFYLFAEWGNLYVMAALMTALFLGGWQVPGVTEQEMALSPALIVVGWGIFTLKALFLVFVVIWLRWTLPRVRVDQLMSACWKYLVPLGALVFIGAASWRAFVKGTLQLSVSVMLFGIGVLVCAIFVRRIVRLLRQGPYEVTLKPFL